MKSLFEFLNTSYTAFFAVKNISEMLETEGFTKLDETSTFTIEPGKSYYVVRNTSSIIAFKVPKDCQNSFNIVASHSDSPSFKLKPNALLEDNKNGYFKLNTECYGGMIKYTWLDRPLGIAGRVFIEEDDIIKEKLVNFDETIFIPSLAIHMTRSDEFIPNPQIDMIPLFSCKKNFEETLAKYAKGKILSHDLFLYNKEEACYAGMNNEYILSSRLDDLECAYTSIVSLIKSNPKSIAVSVAFNNEETGSTAYNAADSTFLTDTLERICEALGKNYKQMLASSFIVSSDNAHAVHPNHPEKSDSTNAVYMNKGIVIKHHASQKYTTDALSEAIFKKICNDNNILYQDYTNRSDIRGGSTLGAISQTHLSIPSVDIGLAQLAMHSIYESCGSKDVEYMINGLTSFYNTSIKFVKDKIILNK